MPEKKEEKKKPTKYYKGIGRRKSAVAQVRLFALDEKKSSHEGFIVNGRKLNDFFGPVELRDTAIAPLISVQETASFDASVIVRGGGIRGQAEAIRLGVARALVIFNESLRKPLRDLGYLTRDARVVERKKSGLKKARRAPQWKKR
ncbi:MAG: 30S ribosomal protein S9 [Parcubacteria group bacterium]|jgi:small subunit ribosomal protein S9